MWLDSNGVMMMEEAMVTYSCYAGGVLRIYGNMHAFYQSKLISICCVDQVKIKQGPHMNLCNCQE